MELLRLWVDTIDPQACFFEILNQANQIAHAPDRDMIERSGRYFRHHRCQTDCPPLRDEHSMNTSRFGRPQDRAQVMRIFDSVKEHEKRLLTSRLRPIKDLLRCVVGFCGDKSNDALVVSARYQSIEGRRRFDVNGNSLRLSKLDKIVELPISPQHE